LKSAPVFPPKPFLRKFICDRNKTGVPAVDEVEDEVKTGINLLGMKGMDNREVEVVGIRGCRWGFLRFR
jgi:hypothetical protein